MAKLQCKEVPGWPVFDWTRASGSRYLWSLGIENAPPHWEIFAPSLSNILTGRHGRRARKIQVQQSVGDCDRPDGRRLFFRVS